jgi:XTP/dITP diphosphohydrolase
MEEQSPLNRFTLVTSSEPKRREIFDILRMELLVSSIDLPEIQSLDLREILSRKAREAFDRLKVPVVVEDVSLELSAFKGFPGPLVKWLIKTSGPKGVIALCRAVGDMRARAVCGVLAWDGEREYWAEGAVYGTIADAPRGVSGFGWDPVFIPAGSECTFAEMTAGEKNSISHRGKAWRKFGAGLVGGKE